MQETPPRQQKRRARNQPMTEWERRLWDVFLGSLSYRQQPEALDAFLATAQVKQRLSDEEIQAIRRAALLKLGSDSFYGWQGVFSYLATGMVALDIILLTVLVPLGFADYYTTSALYTLAISLVLSGAYLVIDFSRKEIGFVTYGWLQRLLYVGALSAGGMALFSTFSHVSERLGITFAVVAFAAYLICGIYVYSIRRRQGRVVKQSFQDSLAQLSQKPVDMEA